jgi:hypothetical protein
MEIKITTEELVQFKNEHSLTKEYLRRALLKLKKATEYFDVEADDVDEFEDEITKFIGEVKRKRLI